MIPDVANWCWYEYGMRVGFWRLRRMFNRLGISPTITINAVVCETYPQGALETIMQREGVVVWNGPTILDWYREQTELTI